MTVLEETVGPVMTSGLGADRYITPEYLAPLPQVPPSPPLSRHRRYLARI